MSKEVKEYRTVFDWLMATKDEVLEQLDKEIDEWFASEEFARLEQEEHERYCLEQQAREDESEEAEED